MTNLVEWTDALSVGVDEIDAQHKVLVNLLNELHDAIEHRHGNEAVAGVLTQLTEYTRIHFAVEESLMRMLGYPGFEAHREEHRELIAQVNDLRRRFETGKGALGFELMHFLKLWLTRHIMESDQQYAVFFRESGASPRQPRRSWSSRLWTHLNG